jgi:hypothetical protein
MQSKTAQPDLSAAFSELAHENNGKNAEKLPVYMEMLNYFKHIVVQIYLVPYAVAQKKVRDVRTCIPWISRLYFSTRRCLFRRRVQYIRYPVPVRCHYRKGKGTYSVNLLETGGGSGRDEYNNFSLRVSLKIPCIPFCFTRLNFLPDVLYCTFFCNVFSSVEHNPFLNIPAQRIVMSAMQIVLAVNFEKLP